jgi:DNA invertase Pin-like site-specific DNA recombinase
MIYKATRSDHPLDHVVVHSLSGFSRDALHSELYVRQLRKAGVELVSITQDVGQDGTGEFIRKMLNVFDERQSRENAKHVHRAMLETRGKAFGMERGLLSVTASSPGRCAARKKRKFSSSTRRKLAPSKKSSVSQPESGAAYLNERGITRRGLRFSTGSV